MTVSSLNLLSSIITSTKLLTIQPQRQQSFFVSKSGQITRTSRKQHSFRVQAVKPPSGVVVPKMEPKLQAPFLGFTTTAEIWNSRACMIGLVGIFIVELILNQGILEVIGVDVGKGLNLPL